MPKSILLVTSLAAAGCSMIPGLQRTSSAGPKADRTSDSSDSNRTGAKSAPRAAEPPKVADRKAPVGRAPDWCKGYESSDSVTGPRKELGYDKAGNTLANRVASASLDDDDRDKYVAAWDEVGYWIAARACEMPDDEEIQAQTDKYRQLYVKYFGLTARDFNDLMFLVKNGEASTESFCGSVPKRGSVVVPKNDIELGIFASVCSGSAAQHTGWYGGDVPTPPVTISLGNLPVGDTTHFSDMGFGRSLGWLKNQIDLDNLDRDRLETEIASYPLVVRVRMRERFALAKRLAKARDQAVASLDAPSKKLVAAATAATKAWMQAYEANKDEIDLAMTTLSRAAAGEDLGGCADPLRKAATKVARSQKLKANKDAWRALNGMPMQPLVKALAACAASEGDLTAALAIRALYNEPNALYFFTEGSHAKPLVGPRAAALEGAVAAMVAMKPSRDVHFEGGNIIAPAWSREPSLPAGEYVELDSHKNTGLGAGAGHFGLYGTVASIKRSGDFATITFKKEKGTYYDVTCADTHEITGVDASGKYEYRTVCSYGSKHTMNITEGPIRIRASQAAGISAGAVVTFALHASSNNPKLRDGFPLLVHKDAKRTALVAIVGTDL